MIPIRLEFQPLPFSVNTTKMNWKSPFPIIQWIKKKKISFFFLWNPNESNLLCSLKAASGILLKKKDCFWNSIFFSDKRLLLEIWNWCMHACQVSYSLVLSFFSTEKLLGPAVKKKVIKLKKKDTSWDVAGNDHQHQYVSTATKRTRTFFFSFAFLTFFLDDDVVSLVGQLLQRQCINFFLLNMQFINLLSTKKSGILQPKKKKVVSTVSFFFYQIIQLLCFLFNVYLFLLNVIVTIIFFYKRVLLYYFFIK